MTDAEFITKTTERLAMLGYTVTETDVPAVEYCCEKVKNTIKNDCNLTDILDGLCHISIDMSVGEFLLAKKTFAPGDLEGLDLTEIVKSIQTGDTTVQFDTGVNEAASLDSIINYFLTNGRKQFCFFRKLRW
jgi:hypothetical protein